MSQQSDLSYFRQRWVAAKDAAAKANNSGAKIAHRQLAAAYARRIDAIVSGDVAIARGTDRPTSGAAGRAPVFATPPGRRSVGVDGLLRLSSRRPADCQAS